MKYVNLGNTDIKVSPLTVGCMSFGKNSDMFKWSLDYDESKKVISHALDLGLNFFDTANVYSEGSSEEFLGRSLKDLAIK